MQGCQAHGARVRTTNLRQQKRGVRVAELVREALVAQRALQAVEADVRVPAPNTTTRRRDSSGQRAKRQSGRGDSHGAQRKVLAAVVALKAQQRAVRLQQAHQRPVVGHHPRHRRPPCRRRRCHAGNGPARRPVVAGPREQLAGGARGGPAVGAGCGCAAHTARAAPSRARRPRCHCLPCWQPANKAWLPFFFLCRCDEQRGGGGGARAGA